MKEQILTGLLRAHDSGSLSFGPADLTKGEWEEVISLAERHRLAPQLFVRLHEHDTLSALPDDMTQRLRNKYLGGIARGMQLSAELAGILEYFNKKNIPVIVLKGPHLAEIVYKDWALRPMCDFDLMVKRNDLGRALKALKEIGYEASLKLHADTQVMAHAHLPLLRKGERFIVELHFSLEASASPFTIDIEGVWQRARETTISGVKALVLSNEDFLLHLCTHATYHHRLSIGLLPLRDIAETMQCLIEDIDWEKLKNIAKKWRAERCLSLAVSLAKEFFGLDGPAGAVGNNLILDCDQNISEIARERIFRTPDNDLPLTDNIARLWEKEGFWRKAKIFFEYAFPSPDVLATQYPVDPSSKRIYLYYPVRLKDLFVRYGKTVLLLFRRDTHAVKQIEKEEQGNLLVDWLTSELSLCNYVIAAPNLLRPDDSETEPIASKDFFKCVE